MKDPYENKYVDAGVLSVHYSRIIASWVNEYVPYVVFDNKFKEWLRSLPFKFTDNDIADIVNLARDGKFELEYNARHFIAENE